LTASLPGHTLTTFRCVLSCVHVWFSNLLCVVHVLWFRYVWC